MHWRRERGRGGANPAGSGLGGEAGVLQHCPPRRPPGPARQHGGALGISTPASPCFSQVPTYRWEWNCHPSGPGVSPDQKGMGLGPHASPTPIPTCFVWHPPSPAVPSLTRNTGRTSRPQPAQATAPAPLPHGLLPTGHRPGQQRPRSRWVGGDPDPGVPAAQCQESPKLASEEEGGLGPALH